LISISQACFELVAEEIFSKFDESTH
jgi:hypothetical protein